MEFVNLKWTKETYEKYSKFLTNQSDENYKNFHSKLCKTSNREILGVRLPILQGIAKEIAKGECLEFLKACPENTYEEIMIEGLVIAKMKKSFNDKVPYIKEFVPKIDNWAVCDSFCAALKVKEKEYDEMVSLCLEYSKSPYEYEMRFAIVLLMDNLKNEKLIDIMLELSNSIPCEHYYVSMAAAWAISVCFVKSRDKTLNFLKSNRLDDITLNKALRKIIESNRVSNEDKAMIRNMKR